MWLAYLLFHGCFTLTSDVTADSVKWSGRTGESERKDKEGERAYLYEILLCGVKLCRRNSYIMASAWLEVCL